MGGRASVPVWQVEIPSVPAHYSYGERRHLVRIYIHNAGVRSTDPICCGIRSTTGRSTLAVDDTDDIRLLHDTLLKWHF